MEPVRWWQECVFYQIYLPAFCDGNADGRGDFIGLMQKIDYLHELGIGGIWITPFYPSPMVDNGYDISDYCAVDPRFGQFEDFSRVVAACHARGIRVVIDLVLNHVSSQHPWFVDAWNNPASRYRDYFIFTDRPNNWQSFFSGSAWTPEPDTGQFYYHKFAPQQVDLNWQNPQVEQEINRVMDFWLAAGVDGFRFDVINFLTTDGIGADNPESAGVQEHLHDVNQPGLMDVLRRLMAYARAKGDLFLIGEIGSEDLAVLGRYQGADRLDVVFNFNLGSQKTFLPQAIFSALTAMHEQQPGLPTLFFSSHDMSRMISRFGETERDTARARAVLALQLTARGVPFIYQGEEFGLTDFRPQCLEEIVDVQGRTHYQTARAAGMTAEQALEIALTHTRDASRAPLPWGDKDALWKDYRELIALRNRIPVLRHGQYTCLTLTDACLWFSRIMADEQVWVAINFGAPVRNPWHAVAGEVLYGDDAPWLAKNQFVIKRSGYEKAQ